jgi:hypothetical protein
MDSCGLLSDLYYYGYDGVDRDYEQTAEASRAAGISARSTKKGLGGARNYAAARAL